MELAWILMSLLRREMCLGLENESLYLHSLAYFENITECVPPTQTHRFHCLPLCNYSKGKFIYLRNFPVTGVVQENHFLYFGSFTSGIGLTGSSFSLLRFTLVASSWHIAGLSLVEKSLSLSNTLNKCLWFNQLKFYQIDFVQMLNSKSQTKADKMTYRRCHKVNE